MSESAIIMTKQAARVDPTIRSQAYSFLEKLAENDAAPGLHIEPLHNVVDPRVRTGRVNIAYRAVLFRLDHAGQRSYVVHDIWHHDDAIRRAQRARLKLNPLNGIPEITEDDELPVTDDVVATPTTRQVVDDQPTVLGHTPAELVAGLGLDEEMARRVAECTSDDDLLEYATSMDEWQGLALISLSQGSTMDQVREQYQLRHVAEADADSTEEIIKSIRTNPTSQAVFSYVSDAGELRRIIEGARFSDWRTWLHPTQRRLAENDYNGSYRLAGGAGTGKTVVLLHRARRLTRGNPNARVLLTTFTTNLAEQVRQSVTDLDPALPLLDEVGKPGLLVLGIDALASAVLRNSPHITAAAEAVFGIAGAEVGRRTPGDAWQEALLTAGDALPAPLQSAAFLSAEYESVVLPNRITTLAQYARVSRPGRGVRLSRPQRIAVWDVISAYRARAHAAGTIDFAEAAVLAAECCDRAAQAGEGRLFGHVLVDEGQDLGPGHLQLIRALVAEGPNDIFVAEDAHQRIYGQRLVLSRYGLNIRGRSTRLKLNYRTTAENLDLARAILQGADWIDSEGEPETSADYRSLRNGPKPQVRQYAGVVNEYDAAADQIRAWVEQVDEPETIAVLVRDRKHRDQTVAALDERGVRVRSVDRGKVPPGMPVVLTMHRAKGTEFSRVLLLGVSENNVPARFAVQAHAPEDQDEAVLRERALLYVAASRARDELVISYSGAASPLLPDQPVMPPSDA